MDEKQVFEEIPENIEELVEDLEIEDTIVDSEDISAEAEEN